MLTRTPMARLPFVKMHGIGNDYVYVATFDQERTVYFDDLMPVGATHTFKAPLPGIRNVLFVVDRTNTKPGTSGRIWISRAVLQQ